MINCRICDKINNQYEWLFSRVYGPLKADRKKDFWNLIPSLKLTLPTPWIVVEDFNEILFHPKKIGRQT